MRHNPKLDVKIKLVPRGGEATSQWLHVKWFKVGGCKPRKYVDQYWLTENESEATLIEPFRAKTLAYAAKTLMSFEGRGDSKIVCVRKSGRKWVPISLKKAVAEEIVDRANRAKAVPHN